MRRHAYLGRYAAWQLLDYFYPAGLLTLIIVSLIAWVVVKQIHMLQRIVASHPGAVLAADPWAAQLPPVFYILAFLGVLLASHGIVSEGRRLRYYRFLFAKPLNPLAYHGQAFVVNGIGFVTLSTLLIALFSFRIHPVWSWQFVPALVVIYLCFGGIGFLLSTLMRGDGLLLMVVIMVAYSLWGSWDAATGWRHWAVRALPPTPRLGDLVTLAFGTTTAFPWESAGWLAGYGLVCFAIGLVVLRFRSFGEA
jgi:hypothetical protein